jgi:hypothetical protein
MEMGKGWLRMGGIEDWGGDREWWGTQRERRLLVLPGLGHGYAC